MDRFRFTQDAPAVSMQMAADLAVGGTWEDPHVPTTSVPAAARPWEDTLNGRTGSGRGWTISRPAPDGPAALTLLLDREGRDFACRVLRWATGRREISTISLVGDEGGPPLIEAASMAALIRSILGADRLYDDGTLRGPSVTLAVDQGAVEMQVPDYVSWDLQRAAVLAAWAGGYDVRLKRVQA